MVHGYNPNMDEAQRFYRILSGYVEREWERIRGIVDDADAEWGGGRHTAAQELDEMNPSVPPAPTSPPVAQPPKPNSLDQQYAVLALEPGASFAIVRSAYQKLMRRTDPTRFEAGTEAATQASQIREKVEAAYADLRKALDPSASRFSDLGK
jgi:DnaJ-domain-containing protein 1